MDRRVWFRLLLIRIRETLFHIVLKAFFLVVPPSATVVVHGWRDGEENALLLAEGLITTGRCEVPVTLLCEDTSVSTRYMRLVTDTGFGDRLEIVRKNSLAGIWRFVRARVVFSTHGVFCNPAPGRRRLHVLLGHGHGPKSASNPLHPFLHRVQVATTNNGVWGRAVIGDQGIDVRKDAFVTGNPRDDVFFRHSDRSRLAQLGIDPDKPLVLWLPTYRVPRNEPGLTDLAEIGENEELRELVEKLHEQAQRHGVTIATKAHQLDDQRNVLGWGSIILTDQMLLEAGLSFFGLLSIADGLVSDYSSVWVDYLARERPVALVFADDAEFARGRGLNSPQISEVAAELIVDSDETMTAFMEDVIAGFTSGVSSAAAVAVADRLELRRDPGATQRVLEVVRDRLESMRLPPVFHLAR